MQVHTASKKSIFTSVSTVCLGDEIKVAGKWHLVVQIVSPTPTEPHYVLLTQFGTVELSDAAMVEVAS